MPAKVETASFLAIFSKLGYRKKRNCLSISEKPFKIGQRPGLMQTISPLSTIAHRGARSLAPENTMAAFLKAWQVGAHGVETDVSVTADGELMLFHDNTLLRTSDVARKFPVRKEKQLYTFSWKEIQMLDVGSWFVETDPFGTIAQALVPQAEQQAMRGIGVPLLDELLLFVKEKSWFINIEIKPLPHQIKQFPVVEKVLEQLEKAGLAKDHFSISSFHHPFLRQVQALRPDIEINALIGGERLRKQDWGNFEFGIYNANVRHTDAAQIKTAQQHGCRINLYTVNKEEEMRYFLSLGVEKIITDYPQLLVQMQQEGSIRI